MEQIRRAVVLTGLIRASDRCEEFLSRLERAHAESASRLGDGEKVVHAGNVSQLCV